MTNKVLFSQEKMISGTKLLIWLRFHISEFNNFALKKIINRKFI